MISDNWWPSDQKHKHGFAQSVLQVFNYISVLVIACLENSTADQITNAGSAHSVISYEETKKKCLSFNTICPIFGAVLSSELRPAWTTNHFIRSPRQPITSARGIGGTKVWEALVAPRCVRARNECSQWNHVLKMLRHSKQVLPVN